MTDISEVLARLQKDTCSARSGCTERHHMDIRALLDNHARQAEMLEDYQRLLTVALNTKISSEETEKLRKEIGL